MALWGYFSPSDSPRCVTSGWALHWAVAGVCLAGAHRHHYGDAGGDGRGHSRLVGGFDTLYALQDREYDQEVGLNSIPARLGEVGALRVSGAPRCGGRCLLALP